MSVALPTTAAKVVFCPDCGSPSIDTTATGIFASDPGKLGCSCRACGWKGVVADIATATFQHSFGSDEELAKAIAGDLRLLLAKECASPLGKFLMKWGFLDVQTTKQGAAISARQLGRYMSAIARALLTSVIEEREKMEKEKISGS